MGILDWFKVDNQTANALDAAQAAEANKPREQLIAENLKKFKDTSARNIATEMVVPSAIARLPTSVVEAVQGVDQIVNSFGERSGSISENLSRARYRTGGYDEIQNFLTKKQEEFQAANPDATPKQIKEFVSKFQNTPEYIAFERGRLPERLGMPIYKTVENINDKIDNFFGAPTDTVKTNTENVLQNATQALVPVNIASKLPTALRVASEFLLPGNQAITKGGKLAVAGAAGALTAGVQAGLGRDVKPEEYTEQQAALPAVKYPELNVVDTTSIPNSTEATNNSEQIGSFAKLIPGMESLGMIEVS